MEESAKLRVIHGKKHPVCGYRIFSRKDLWIICEMSCKFVKFLALKEENVYN